jgi:hypothetical protein
MYPVFAIYLSGRLTTNPLRGNLLDVVPGGKVGSLGAEDDASNIVATVTFLKNSVEFRLHRAVDGVHLLRAIQPNLDDRADLFQSNARRIRPLTVHVDPLFI